MARRWNLPEAIDRRVGAMAAIAALVLGGCSSATTAPEAEGQTANDSKPAAVANETADSPERAVARLAAAFQNGDFKSLATVYAEPYAPLLIEWHEAREISQAERRLAEALQSRWGDAGAKGLNSTADAAAEMKRVLSLRIEEKKPNRDGFDLLVETVLSRPDVQGELKSLEPMRAVKQGDQWRLLPAVVADQGLDSLRDSVLSRRRTAERLEAIVVAIEAGQYRKLEDVREAIVVVLEEAAGVPRVSSKPEEKAIRE